MSNLLFILNFHGLGRPPHELPSGERRYWIEPSFFEAILNSIRGRNDIQLTFDDSNESDHEIALPALQARNMTAKFFVVVQRVDQRGYLSVSHLQSLVSAGMTIGSHGMQHRPWAGLSPQDLHEELVGARNRLEQMMGMPISDAACPFGSYNRRVLHALEKSGYNRIYTSDGGPAFAGSWIQPRNTVLRADDLTQIERIVSEVPHGLRRMWRRIKLTLKRWR